jgi:hypothetical protein
MKRVDFQSHIFPRGFIRSVASSQGQLRIVGPDEMGRHVIVDSMTNGVLTYYSVVSIFGFFIEKTNAFSAMASTTAGLTDSAG